VDADLTKSVHLENEIKVMWQIHTIMNTWTKKQILTSSAC
jgi:hypothetical protein